MDDFKDRSQFRIGDLMVVPASLVVVRNGQEIKFEPRWMQVLVMLAEHAGETLSTERLLIEVWGSAIYGDSPVSKTISYIRKSIGDDSRKPRYIETVSKVGYKLIEPVSLPEDYRRMPSERWTEGSPYVGLSAFDADHASVFCGRSRIVADLLRAMRIQIENQRRFVLIVGASGCGKTSLLRAGAIPLLTKPDGFDGLRALSVTTCDLAANGSDPLIPLTAALAKWTLGDRSVFPPQTPEQLKTLLTETPEMIASFVSEAFRRHFRSDLDEQPYAHLLLTVDHAEALVATADIDANARDTFARVLRVLCACPHVMVTMIARGDFYLKLIEALPALAEYKAGDGHLDVMAPRYGEIGEIIRSPAWKADLSFETDPETRTRLDDALRDAALSQPDALPLLQHTLQTLYERRNDQRQLTFSAYNDIGGLEGAIAHRAEQVFAALPTKAQASLNNVLAKLIVILPDSDAISARRADIDAFDTDDRALIDAFIRARLFVGDFHNGHASVGVVHEALLRRWPRAVEWTQDNRRLLQARARLQRAAARWVEEGKQDDHVLNPGRPLGESLEVLAKMPGDLNPDMHDLIVASNRNDRNRRRTRKIALIVLVIFGVSSAFLAAVANYSWKAASARGAEAESANTFILKEIAQNLEHIGDLELMEKIGSRATFLYEGRATESMSLQDLINFSRALRIRGSVRMKKGHLRQSHSDFISAERAAEAAVSMQHTSIDAQYEFSQTSYWLGYYFSDQKIFSKAREHWFDYLKRSERLRKMDIINPEFFMEESYAYNNLAVLSESIGDTNKAFSYLENSYRLKTNAVAISDRAEWQKELADTQSWIGMTLESSGRLEEAKIAFDGAIDRLEPIVAHNLQNKEWAHQLSKFRQLGAMLDLSRGQIDESQKSIEISIYEQSQLAESNSSHYNWNYSLATAHQIAGDIERVLSKHQNANNHYEYSLKTLAKIEGERKSAREIRLDATIRLGQIRLRGYSSQPEDLEVIASRLSVLNAKNPDDVHIAIALADALILLGTHREIHGDALGARVNWQQILQLFATRRPGEIPPKLMAARAIALLRLHEKAAALKYISQLAAIGYRHPDYLATLQPIR